MVTHTPPVAGNLPIKTLVARQRPTNTHTQTQPPDWDDGSHGSSEDDDFDEDEETTIAPVSASHEHLRGVGQRGRALRHVLLMTMYQFLCPIQSEPVFYRDS